MKVRFKQCLSGPDVLHLPGAEVEMPSEEALSLIEAGIVEAIKAAPKRTQATTGRKRQPKREKAVKP